MPPEILEHLPWIAAGIGLITGILLTALVMAARHGKVAATLGERLRAEAHRSAELETRLARTDDERGQHERAASELRARAASMQARVEHEVKASAEKQALLERAEKKLSDTFKALSADALKSSAEQFLQLAKTSLRATNEEARGDLDKRRLAVEQMVKPVAESLDKVQARIGEIEKLREGAYGELRAQVRAMGETQVGLQRETAQLVKALRQPTGRGQWGEIQLRRVVEMAGMQEHCDFETQASTTDDEGRRLRPDLIVRLPGGKTIVVDSKTPMDAYLDAIEATDDDARDDALARHARQVRTHITQLAAKSYAAQFSPAPEFVVLFLPSESFFSAALQQDSGLIEKGVDLGVILATPTTLIALLRAVSYGWRQEALAENAREISMLGRSLYERLGTLGEHFLKLGKSLDRSVQNYNGALASFETRVLPAARKFEGLKAAPENAALPDLVPVDKVTRTPQELPVDEAVGEIAELEPEVEAESEPKPGLPGDDLAAAAEDFEAVGGNFGFVPDAPSSAKAAADDLRAAFGEVQEEDEEDE